MSRPWAFRLFSIFFGVLVTLAAVELGLRIVYPDSGMPSAHRQNVPPDAVALFKPDPECGYLIEPGTGAYGPEGCLVNGYDVAHRKGTRVLFVGDSVTRRGAIVNALRRLYGDEDYEYWNAGVESFNTVQELVLYRRHNAAIKPDHVILTFHNNDFSATPLVIVEKSEIRIFQQSPIVNPWLFEKSYLYRWAWPRSESRDRPARATVVLDSLRDWKALLAQQHVRFTVVLAPILEPFDAWSGEERWSRERSLAIFRELDLRVFDLLPALEAALKDGVAAGEQPGDDWHPSEAVGESFAQALARDGLLK